MTTTSAPRASAMRHARLGRALAALALLLAVAMAVCAVSTAAAGRSSLSRSSLLSSDDYTDEMFMELEAEYRAEPVARQATSSKAAKATSSKATGSKAKNKAAGGKSVGRKAAGSKSSSNSTASRPCSPRCGPHGHCSVGRCRCAPGWSGAACRTETACPNGCSHHGVCHKGVCSCEAYWGGADCSVLTLPSWPCPKLDGRECGGRGVCHLGQCFCHESFSGPDCSIAKQNCPDNCGGLGQGQCRFGQCFCEAGFEGPACQHVKQCTATCEKHGVCLKGECKCAAGWSGKQCDQPVAPSVKQQALEHDLLNSVIAAAEMSEPPVARPNCGQLDAPCGVHGLCVKDQCRCEAGWSGVDCSQANPDAEVETCSPDCGANGECLFGKCVCLPGFTGAVCDQPVFLPCPNDCSSHGLCYLGACECHPGFHGRDCSQVKSCPQGCVRGACVQGVCECVFGFRGANCSEAIPEAELPQKDYLSLAGLDTCGGNGCGLHGSCIAHQCVCVEGYAGALCDLPVAGFVERPLSSPTPANPAVADVFGSAPCSINCGPHGLCVGAACMCVDGWAGDDCMTRVPEVQSHKRYGADFLSILTKKARVEAQAAQQQADAEASALREAIAKAQGISLVESDANGQKPAAPVVVRQARTTAMLAPAPINEAHSQYSPDSKHAVGTVDAPVLSSSRAQVRMNNAAAAGGFGAAPGGGSYSMSISPALFTALCFLTGVLVTIALRCVLDKRDQEKRKMKKMEELLQPAA